MLHYRVVHWFFFLLIKFQRGGSTGPLIYLIVLDTCMDEEDLQAVKVRISSNLYPCLDTKLIQAEINKRIKMYNRHLLHMCQAPDYIKLIWKKVPCKENVQLMLTSVMLLFSWHLVLCCNQMIQI